MAKGSKGTLVDLTGRFMIASSTLHDPNFARSVVLIVQHDEQGALGLVINRPLQVVVAGVLEQALGRPFDIEDWLYLGGPCEGPLMALHTYENAGDMNPVAGVFFASKRETLERLLEERPECTARYFAGYAGWTAGQLETEIAGGSWLSTIATAEQVFGETDKLWEKLGRLAVLERVVPSKLIPPEPGLN